MDPAAIHTKLILMLPFWKFKYCWEFSLATNREIRHILNTSNLLIEHVHNRGWSLVKTTSNVVGNQQKWINQSEWLRNKGLLQWQSYSTILWVLGKKKKRLESTDGILNSYYSDFIITDLRFIGILVFQSLKLPESKTSRPPCSQPNTVGTVLFSGGSGSMRSSSKS